jgi:hypothetical protein
VVALVSFTVACSQAHASKESVGRTRAIVLFAGDSNIVLAAGGITNNLISFFHTEHAYVPVFASRTGAGIRQSDCPKRVRCDTFDYWQVKLGETLAKVDVDALVTNLGINDTDVLGSATTPGYADYGRKIDWLMKLLPKGKPVFWTDLPCDLEPHDRQTGCSAVNTALREAPNRWPNFVILPWARLAKGHRDYMNSADPDELHYSNLGRAVWTQLVADALDAHFPVPK